MTGSTFTAVVALNGKTATGIEVPAEVIEGLGGGKRPAVRVALGDHELRTTVGVMGGRFWIPVTAATRAASGVAAGDRVTVTLRLDTEPREVDVPPALAAALKKNPAARRRFESLSNSGKKRHTLSVEGAKTDETRDRRVAKAIAELEAAEP